MHVHWCSLACAVPVLEWESVLWQWSCTSVWLIVGNHWTDSLWLQSNKKDCNVHFFLTCSFLWNQHLQKMEDQGATDGFDAPSQAAKEVHEHETLWQAMPSQESDSESHTPTQLEFTSPSPRPSSDEEETENLPPTSLIVSSKKTGLSRLKRERIEHKKASEVTRKRKHNETGPCGF